MREEGNADKLCYILWRFDSCNLIFCLYPSQLVGMETRKHSHRNVYCMTSSDWWLGEDRGATGVQIRKIKLGLETSGQAWRGCQGVVLLLHLTFILPNNNTRQRNWQTEEKCLTVDFVWFRTWWPLFLVLMLKCVQSLNTRQSTVG